MAAAGRDFHEDLAKAMCCQNPMHVGRMTQAFGTSAEMWAGMQLQYDHYQAGKLKRPNIERLAA